MINLTSLFSGISDNWYYLWISVSIFGSLYSYTWDIYMDWGLMRSREKGKFGLRSKITFSRWYYYFAMVTDLLLKFTWIFTFIEPKKLENFFYSLNFYILFLEILEGLRRTQWVLLRVENENINNFEKYRNILEIPKMRYEDEEQDLLKTKKKN